MRNLWNRETRRQVVASLAAGLSLSVAATFLGNAVAPQIATAAPAQQLKVHRILASTPKHTFVIPQAADILGGIPNTISGDNVTLPLRPQGAFFTETEFPRAGATLGGIEYPDEDEVNEPDAVGYRPTDGIIMRLRSNPTPIQAKISKDDTQPSTWTWSGWRIYYRQYDQDTKATSQWRTCTATGANALLITGSGERNNLICPNSEIHYEVKGGHIQYGLSLAYTATRGDKKYLAWTSIELSEFADHIYPAFYFSESIMGDRPPHTRGTRDNKDASTAGFEIPDLVGIGFTSRKDIPRVTSFTVSPTSETSLYMGFPKLPDTMNSNPERYAMVTYHRLVTVDEFNDPVSTTDWTLCFTEPNWMSYRATSVINAGADSPQRNCKFSGPTGANQYRTIALQVVDLYNGNVGKPVYRQFKGMKPISQAEQEAFDKAQQATEDALEEAIKGSSDSSIPSWVRYLGIALAVIPVAISGTSLFGKTMLDFVEGLFTPFTFKPAIRSHSILKYTNDDRASTELDISGLGKSHFLSDWKVGYRSLRVTCVNTADATDTQIYRESMVGKRGSEYPESKTVTLNLKRGGDYKCTAETENPKGSFTSSEVYSLSIEPSALTGLSITSVTEGTPGKATVAFTAAEPLAQRTYYVQYREKGASGDWGTWLDAQQVDLSAEKDTGSADIDHKPGVAREYRVATANSSGTSFFSNVAPFSIGTTRLPADPFAEANTDGKLIPPNSATAKVRAGTFYSPGSTGLVSLDVNWAVEPAGSDTEIPLYAVYVKELLDDNALWKTCSGLRGEATTKLTANCGIGDDKPYLISVHSARPGGSGAMLSKPVVILFDPLLMQKDTAETRAAQAGSEQLLTYIYSSRQMASDTNYATMVNNFNRVTDSAAKAGRAAYETRMMAILAKIANMIPATSVTKPKPLTGIDGSVNKYRKQGETFTEIVIDYETPTFTDLTLPQKLNIKCAPTGSNVGTEATKEATFDYPQAYRKDTTASISPNVAGSITCTGYTKNTGANGQEQVSDGLSFDINVGSTNLEPPRISNASWQLGASIVDVQFKHSLLDDTGTYRVQARELGDPYWLNGEPKAFDNTATKGNLVAWSLGVTLDSRKRWEIRVQATNAPENNLNDATWTSSAPYTVSIPPLSAPRSGLYTYTEDKKHRITWKSPQFPETGDANVSYWVRVKPNNQTWISYECGSGYIAAGQPRECLIENVLEIGVEHTVEIIPYFASGIKGLTEREDFERSQKGHPLVFTFIAGSSGFEKSGDFQNGVSAETAAGGGSKSDGKNGLGWFVFIVFLGFVAMAATTIIAGGLVYSAFSAASWVNEATRLALKPTKPRNIRVTSDLESKDDTVPIGSPLQMKLTFTRSEFPTEDNGKWIGTWLNYWPELASRLSSGDLVPDTTQIEKENIRYMVNCRLGEGDDAPRLPTATFTAGDAPDDQVEMFFPVRRTAENSDEKVTCEVTPTLWGSSVAYRVRETFDRNVEAYVKKLPLVGEKAASLIRALWLGNWKEEYFTGDTASGTSKTLGWESVRGNVRVISAEPINGPEIATRNNYDGAGMKVTWSKLTRPDVESKDDTVVYFIDIKPESNVSEQSAANGAIRYSDADLKQFALSVKVVETDDTSPNQSYTFNTGVLQTTATISPVKYKVTVYAAVQGKGESEPDLENDKTISVADASRTAYPRLLLSSGQAARNLKGAASPITGQPKQSRSKFTQIDVPFRLGYMPKVTSGSIPFTGKVGVFCSSTVPGNEAFWDDTTLPAKLTSLRELTLNEAVAKDNSKSFVLYKPSDNAAIFSFDDSSVSPGSQRFCQHIFTDSDGKIVTTEPQEVFVETRSPEVEIVKVNPRITKGRINILGPLMKNGILGWDIHWKKPALNELDKQNGILGYEVRVRKDSSEEWRTIAARTSFGLQALLGNGSKAGDYNVFISAIGIKRQNLVGYDVSVVAITSSAKERWFDHKSLSWWFDALKGFASQIDDWEDMPTTKASYTEDGKWVEVSLPLFVHKLRR